jgi:hypothetical protein
MEPFQFPFQTPDGRDPLQQLQDEYSIPLDERGQIDYRKLSGAPAGPAEAPAEAPVEATVEATVEEPSTGNTVLDIARHNDKVKQREAVKRELARRAAARIIQEQDYSAAPRVIRGDGESEVLPDLNTPGSFFWNKEEVASKGEYGGGLGDWLWGVGGEIGGYEATKSRNLNDIVSDEDINSMLDDIADKNYSVFKNDYTIDPQEFKSQFKAHALAKAMYTNLVENKGDWGAKDETNYKKIFSNMPEREQMMFSNALNSMVEDKEIDQGPVWRFVESVMSGFKQVAHAGAGLKILKGSKTDEQIDREELEAGAWGLIKAKEEEADMLMGGVNTAAEILPPMLVGRGAGTSTGRVAAWFGAGAKTTAVVSGAVSTGFWFDQEVGEIKDRMRAAGLDNSQANLYSTPAAAGIAAMELMQLNRLSRMFGGNKSALLKRVLNNTSGYKNNLTKNIIRTAMEMGKTGVREAGQEALQQTVEEGAMFIASRMHDSDFNLGESFDNVRHSFTDSVLAMALIGAPGSVKGVMAEQRGVDALRSRMNIMDTAVSGKIDGLVESAARSSNPELFKELLDWAANPERAQEAFSGELSEAIFAGEDQLNAPIKSVIEFMGVRLKKAIVESVERNRDSILKNQGDAQSYIDYWIDESLGNVEEQARSQSVADILIEHIDNNPKLADQLADLINDGTVSRSAFKDLLLSDGGTFRRDGSVNPETPSGKLMMKLLEHISSTGADAEVKKKYTTAELMNLSAADFNAWVEEVSGMPGQHELEGSGVSAAQERARLINEWMPEAKFVLPTSLLRLDNQNKRQRKIFSGVMKANLSLWMKAREEATQAQEAGQAQQVEAQQEAPVEAPVRAPPVIEQAAPVEAPPVIEQEAPQPAAIEQAAPQQERADPVEEVPMSVKMLEERNERLGLFIPSDKVPTREESRAFLDKVGAQEEAEEAEKQAVENPDKVGLYLNRALRKDPTNELALKLDEKYPGERQKWIMTAAAPHVGIQFRAEGAQESPYKPGKAQQDAEAEIDEYLKDLRPAELTVEQEVEKIFGQEAQQETPIEAPPVIKQEEVVEQETPLDEAGVERIANTIGDMFGEQGVIKNEERVFEVIETALSGEIDAKVEAQRELINMMGELSEGKELSYLKHGWEPLPDEAARAKKLGDTFARLVDMGYLQNLGEVSSKDIKELGLDPEAALQAAVEINKRIHAGEKVSREEMDSIIYKKHTGQELPMQRVEQQGLMGDSPVTVPRSKMTPGEFVFTEPGTRGIAQIGKMLGEEIKGKAAPEPKRGDPIAPAEQAEVGLQTTGTFYHAGADVINLKQGKPFHVGTQKSAEERVSRPDEAEKSRSVHEVEINIKNPYLVNGEILDERTGAGRTELFLIQNTPSRQEELIAEGYDAVPYFNEAEDEGSISYMILKPEAVKLTGRKTKGRVSAAGKFEAEQAAPQEGSQESVMPDALQQMGVHTWEDFENYAKEEGWEPHELARTMGIKTPPSDMSDADRAAKVKEINITAVNTFEEERLLVKEAEKAARSGNNQRVVEIMTEELPEIEALKKSQIQKRIEKVKTPEEKAYWKAVRDGNIDPVLQPPKDNRAKAKPKKKPKPKPAFESKSATSRNELLQTASDTFGPDTHAYMEALQQVTDSEEVATLITSKAAKNKAETVEETIQNVLAELETLGIALKEVDGKKVIDTSPTTVEKVTENPIRPERGDTVDEVEGASWWGGMTEAEKFEHLGDGVAMINIQLRRLGVEPIKGGAELEDALHNPNFSGGRIARSVYDGDSDIISVEVFFTPSSGKDFGAFAVDVIREGDVSEEGRKQVMASAALPHDWAKKSGIKGTPEKIKKMHRDIIQKLVDEKLDFVISNKVKVYYSGVDGIFAGDVIAPAAASDLDSLLAQAVGHEEELDGYIEDVIFLIEDEADIRDFYNEDTGEVDLSALAPFIDNVHGWEYVDGKHRTITQPEDSDIPPDVVAAYLWDNVPDAIFGRVLELRTGEAEAGDGTYEHPETTEPKRGDRQAPAEEAEAAEPLKWKKREAGTYEAKIGDYSFVIVKNEFTKESEKWELYWGEESLRRVDRAPGLIRDFAQYETLREAKEYFEESREVKHVRQHVRDFGSKQAPAGPQEGPRILESRPLWNLPEIEVDTSDLVSHLTADGEKITFIDREGNRRDIDEFATEASQRVSKESNVHDWLNLPAADTEIDIDRILAMAPGLEYLGIKKEKGTDVHAFKAAHGEILYMRAVKFIPHKVAAGYSEEANKDMEELFKETGVSTTAGVHLSFPGQKKSNVILISDFGLAFPNEEDGGAELEEIIHWAQATGRWSPEINDFLQKEFSEQALVSGKDQADKIEDTAQGLAIAITKALKHRDPVAVGKLRSLLRKMLDWFNDLLVANALKPMNVDYIVNKWLNGEIISKPETMKSMENVMKRQRVWSERKKLSEEEQEELRVGARGIDDMHTGAGLNTARDAAVSLEESMSSRISRLARIKKGFVKLAHILLDNPKTNIEEKSKAVGAASGVLTTVNSYLRKNLRVVPLEGGREARKLLLNLQEEREGFVRLHRGEATRHMEEINRAFKRMGAEQTEELKEIMHAYLKDPNMRKEFEDILVSEIKDPKQRAVAEREVGVIAENLMALRNAIDDLSQIVIDDVTQRSEEMAVIIDENGKVYVTRKYKLYEDSEARMTFLRTTEEGRELVASATQATRDIDKRKKYDKYKESLYKNWRAGKGSRGMKIENVISKDNEFRSQLKGDLTPAQIDMRVDALLRGWFMTQMESPKNIEKIDKVAEKRAMSIQKAQDETFKYLHSPNSYSSGSGSDTGFARNIEQFMKRRKLNNAYKDLYGEIRGARAAGITIASLAENIAGHTFQKSIRESALFDNHISPESNSRLNITVPLIGREYGTLDGMFVTPEFEFVLKRLTGQLGLFNHMKNNEGSATSDVAYALLGASVTAKGMKTLGAPRTASRNSWEETMHAWINGWWSPLSSLINSGKSVLGVGEGSSRASFRQAMAISEHHADLHAHPLIKYIANPGLGNVKFVFGNKMKGLDEYFDTEALELYEEVAKLGLLNNSLQRVWDDQREAVDVKNPLDVASQEDTEDIKVGDILRAGAFSKGVRKFFSSTASNKYMKGASKLYQVSSDATRVMGYVTEKRRINEAIAWEVEFVQLKGKNKTKSEIDAAIIKEQKEKEKATNREAADKVKDLIPTASRVSQLVKEWSAFPVLGNFPVWFTGYIQSMTNQWRIGLGEINSSNDKTIKVGQNRLLRAALTQAVLPALARSLHYLLGLDDDDEEAIKNAMPFYQRNNTLIPIPDLDGEGFSVFDATQSFPSTMFFDIAATAVTSFDEDGMSGVLESGLSESLSMFTDEDIFMSSVADMALRGDTNKFGYQFVDSLDSRTERVFKRIDHMTLGLGEGFRGPLAPGFLAEIARLKQAVFDGETPSGVKRSGLGAFFRIMIGSEAVSFDAPKMLTMRAKEFTDARRKYTRSVNKAGYSSNSAKFKKALASFKEKNAKLYNDMSTIIHAARLGGMSNDDIFMRLHKFGVPMADIEYWMAGVVRGTTMSDKTLEGIYRAAEEKREGSGQEMMKVYSDYKRGDRGE